MQIIYHNKFYDSQKIKYVRRSTYPSYRGNIYDRNGNLLSTEVFRYNIRIDPVFMRAFYSKDSKIREAVKSLANVLNTDYSKLYSYLNNSKNQYMLLKKNVTVDYALKVKENRPYIILQRVKLIETLDPSFKYIVGTKYSSYGLEKYYRPLISPKNDTIISYQIFPGNILNPRLLSYEQGKNGKNLYTTFDFHLQKYVTDLANIKKSTLEASSVYIVIANPFTGDLYAAASSKMYPAFAMDLVEVGSTFKPIVASIALNTSVVSTNDYFYCPKSIYPSKEFDVKISDEKAFGQVTLKDIITHSINVGIIQVAKKVVNRIGKWQFYNNLCKFGVDSSTGLNFFKETPPIVKKPNYWQDLDYAEISIGQAIAMTPLELTRDFMPLVNGGYRVKLRALLSQKINKTRIIKDSVANEIKGYLKNVVENGTGIRAKIKGYNIYGKTGTAQKNINGKFSNSHYYSLFVGFYDKYLITVVVDDPKNGYYGGAISAPIFKEIILWIINHTSKGYLNSNLTYDKKVIPNLIGLTLKDAIHYSLMVKKKLYTDGDGIIYYQWPKPGLPTKISTSIYIKLSP
jgi:cell division protein FtsI (penicillin-binding protein 3)